MTEPVKIVLSDGVERGLRYTFASFREIKKQTGLSFSKDLNAFEALDEDILPTVLFYGLVDRVSITEDEIAELMTLHNLAHVKLNILEALYGKELRKAFEAQLKNEQPKPEAIEPEPETVQTMEGPTTIQTI